MAGGIGFPAEFKKSMIQKRRIPLPGCPVIKINDTGIQTGHFPDNGIGCIRFYRRCVI